MSKWRSPRYGAGRLRLWQAWVGLVAGLVWRRLSRSMLLLHVTLPLGMLVLIVLGWLVLRWLLVLMRPWLLLVMK